MPLSNQHPSTSYSNRYSLWADEFEDHFDLLFRNSEGVLQFSKSFLQLAAWWGNNIVKAATGRSVSKSLTLVLASSIDHQYIHGVESSLKLVTGTNAHNLDYCKLCWRSHSGRIWLPNEEVDPEDIEFWIEDLDWDMVRGWLREGESQKWQIPKLARTKFELVIQQLTIDAEWSIRLKPDVDKVKFESQVSQWINEFNQEVESGKIKRTGVVHNCRFRENTQPNESVAYVDTGSGGDPFYRFILPKISELNQVEKMTII